MLMPNPQLPGQDIFDRDGGDLKLDTVTVTLHKGKTVPIL